MPGRGKRLFDLEIDEVSLVDRPANQHGLVSIAKRAEGPAVTYYDVEGYEVDENAIEVGDVVYDSQGNEFAMVDEATAADLGYEVDPQDGGTPYFNDEVQPERELASVGKRASRRSPVGKSLGQQVMEQLSKAHGDDERNELIAKAFDMVGQVQAENSLLRTRVSKMETERDLTGYMQLAETYELPVDPSELGPVLKRMADHLPAEDLELVDRIFSAAGQGLFDELGVSGTAPSGVMDQMSALAFQAVGKGDTDLSPEAALGALFDANPGAYDEYLHEGRI